MTSTITQVTISAISSSTYLALSSSLGIMAFLLLLVLLVFKELLRALDRPKSKSWMAACDIAIAPLLLAFGVVILVRLIILI